jgi:hypothetical protein
MLEATLQLQLQLVMVLYRSDGYLFPFCCVIRHSVSSYERGHNCEDL